MADQVGVAVTTHRHALGVLALVGSCCLGGLSYLFGKLALAELSVPHVVLYRFTIASLVLMPVLLRERAWPRRADLPLLLLTGTLNVPVTFLIQLAGVQRTTAASAALLVGTLPLLLAVGAVVVYGERLTRQGWLAIGAASIGAVLVVGSPPQGGTALGNGLMMLSLLVVVTWMLLAKGLGRHYSALAVTAYLFISGTLVLWPIALLWAGPPPLALSPATWLWVLLLGVGCSALGNVLWHWGLQRVAATQASIYLHIEPLIGGLAGVLLLGEVLLPTALLGGALIIGAALSTTRFRATAS